MWPRVLELVLACWLAISPFIFRYPGAERALWASDFSCAAVVAALALLSVHPRMRRLHWGHFVVAAWLMVTAYLAPLPPSPPHQNHLLVALLLALLAILPTQVARMPRAWRAFYDSAA